MQRRSLAPRGPPCGRGGRVGSGYVLTGGAEGVGGASGAVRPSERFSLGDEGSEGTGAQGERKWVLAWRRRRSRSVVMGHGDRSVLELGRWRPLRRIEERWTEERSDGDSGRRRPGAGRSETRPAVGEEFHKADLRCRRVAPAPPNSSRCRVGRGRRTTKRKTWPASGATEPS